MNLAVDIGNTRIKVGLFESSDLVEVKKFNNIQSLVDASLSGDFWVFSSVRGDSLLKNLTIENHLNISYKTPLPIILDYKTPETLGVDRFTAAVGAMDRFPDRNVLIIDFGTCITYDILQANKTFSGGIISPGLQMRQQSMYQNTHQLPDISNSWQDYSNKLPGKSTHECLYHGSFSSICMEATGFIENFKKDYEKLIVMTTGGDAQYFESKLKAPIFADPNLVLKGLNKILTHNKLDD